MAAKLSWNAKTIEWNSRTTFQKENTKAFKVERQTQSKELLILNKKVDKIIATIGNSKKEDLFDDIQDLLLIDN